MAMFRKTHIPPVARDYLKLKPSCLRAVVGLGHSPLELFRTVGVPTRRGSMAPLREATSKELRWAAKHLRNWNIGEPIPWPEPSQPKPKSSAEIVAEAVVLLKSAGTISLGDAGRVVRAVVERVEVSAFAVGGDGEADIPPEPVELATSAPRASAGLPPGLLHRRRWRVPSKVAIARWRRRARAGPSAVA
jgi:hypothetical protein